MSLFGPWKDLNKYRFVINENGCWLWQGKRDPCGYGYFYRKRKKMLVHRVCVALFRPLPKIVMHKCDTPRCFNPDHLLDGDTKANMQDAKRKGWPHGKPTGRPSPYIKTFGAE